MYQAGWLALVCIVDSGGILIALYLAWTDSIGSYTI